MPSLVPWSACAHPVRAAALLCQPVETVRARIAALPAGSELVVLVDGDAPLATGLLVLAEIPETGRGALAWASLAPGVAPGAYAPVLSWAQARVRAAGARALQVVERRAPGLGPWLVAQGFAEESALLTLRRGAPRPVPPLPEGLAEAPEAALEPARHAATVNAAFAGVPFSAPYSPADVARLRSAPDHRSDLFRFVLDRGTPAGFLQGELQADGVGVVSAIGLLPAARGRGLGRWLLRRCEALLDAAGAREVRLTVAESNAAARALYAAEGYAQIGRSAAWERPVG